MSRRATGPGFRAAFFREIAHLGRSRWDLGMITLFPLMALAIVAAMLIEGVPRALPVAVVDLDNSAFSRAIVRAAMATPAVRVASLGPDMPRAERLVRGGQMWAILHIPKGAGTGLERARTPAIQIFYNASYLSIGGAAASGLRTAVTTVIAARGAEALHKRGLPAARFVAPTVQVTILFNPQTSFEWYLQALIDPAVLHLLAACVTAMALGRELEGRSLRRWAAETGGGLAALAGKLAPYVLAMSLWGMAWLIWLTGVRGWTMQGSLALTIAAQALLFAGTACISALLIAGLRETSTALSASAIYAGSALAYSGGTLSLDGGNLFARIWSGLLPFSHYLPIQMDQFLGAPAGRALPGLGVLALYVIVPLLALPLLLRRAAR
ncbi:MAG TPA: ABC transporter permease [Sphingobium sp.]|nr:ABC transporter permease [Sphingobium sp.]